MSKVIEFPEPVGLPPLAEAANGAVGYFSKWIDKKRGCEAEFDAVVSTLRKMRRVDWTELQFRFLFDGIYEIKWKWNKVQHRAGGFFYKGKFVILLGFTHKQGVYDPPGWEETLKKRKKMVERGELNVVSYE